MCSSGEVALVGNRTKLQNRLARPEFHDVEWPLGLRDDSFNVVKSEVDTNCPKMPNWATGTFQESQIGHGIVQDCKC